MLHRHVSTVAQDGQTKVWLKNTWPVHVFRAFSSHHEARSIQLVAGPLNYWESGSFLLLLQYCCIVVQYPDEDCLTKTLEIQSSVFFIMLTSVRLSSFTLVLLSWLAPLQSWCMFLSFSEASKSLWNTTLQGLFGTNTQVVPRPASSTRATRRWH